MPVYRTARGNAVDMSTLMAKNEKTRAVGNMNVNARGDIIDNQNKVIKDNTKRVKHGYQKTVSSAQAQKPAQQTTPPIRQNQQPKKPDVVEELTLEEKELFDNDEDFEK